MEVDGAEVLKVHVSTNSPFNEVGDQDEGRTGQFQRREEMRAWLSSTN